MVQRERAPIVLDSDPGLDDAVALQYLLGTGLWDLKAYTAVGGNVPVDQTFRNARALARALGIDGDVPVHRGVGRPFSSEAGHATAFHGVNGLAGVVLPDSARPEQSESAVQALLRLSRVHEGELTLVATGPLTNVAAALVADPGLAHRLRRLVFMGGAARVPGNVTPVAEFNIWADPLAAEIVAGSGVPFTMVGLDATHQWRLDRAGLARIEAAGAGQQLTARLMRFYLDACGGESAPLHDPLAVGVAADEAFVAVETGALAVEAGSELTRGQTVFIAEGRGWGDDDGEPAYPPMVRERLATPGRVAVGRGPRDFSAHFVETVLRVPAHG